MSLLASCNLLVVLGPTASGKTRLAVGLARHFGGEIISADSRQVFQGMDIGSGKDLNEYGTVPYHLIDILPAGEEYNVFRFQQHFLEVFDTINSHALLPILCGGTGMYLDAALRGYRLLPVPENTLLRAELSGRTDGELAHMLQQVRPRQHNTTDLLDRMRTIRAIEIARYEQEHQHQQSPMPEIRPLIFGIRWERALLRRRITDRLTERLRQGMVEEVQSLHDNGISWERLSYYGLEYRYVGAFLRGELHYEEMFSNLNSAIHDFAKRQETWFRRMERNGVAIIWVAGEKDPLAEALEIISSQ